MTPAAADVMHLLVAAALTYALGFERDLRGAPAGDRVFALIGVGAGIVGVLAVHGAPTALQGALTGIGFIGAAAGEGRLLLATAATALALLVLEMRYIPLLRLLDGRRWANRFRDDESPRRPGEAAADDPHCEAGDH